MSLTGGVHQYRTADVKDTSLRHLDDGPGRRQDGRVTVPTDLPVLAFADQAALEEWLEAEHATAPGLYVRIAKKDSGVPSVTYAELVESVLCFGWIDGKAQRLDETAYL